MNLRIYRTFTWEPEPRNYMTPMGAEVHFNLVAHDELQHDRYDPFTGTTWHPIAIVEAEKPEHPNKESK